ncbi:hypothetical protein NNJEOMEG_03302 [Fundidesulfovibrio magnetotacticus]|uniref:Uncharacterized protein n=1 Tax=Fundidesulfovibrio magnetotacticus TaxID=2730080 RepID=A0A6V8LZJ9_9BACT|nr:hypothetical protein [Fundidesulfovibrio magnetotacticus]GFK95439.1 hypothetical protein NNJEOMEG_03302 [Fundidesulfovibrio magnetotacticus]
MSLPEAVQRLLGKFWNADRKTEANPGGFGGNGHEEGFPDALVDVGEACRFAGEQADVARGYAQDAAAAEAQSDAWKDLGWVVEYVGPATFTAVGDVTGHLAAGRAVRADLGASLARSHVAAVEYASATGLTTCKLVDAVLTPALAGVALGQDPANAPRVAYGKVRRFTFG